MTEPLKENNEAVTTDEHKPKNDAAPVVDGDGAAEGLAEYVDIHYLEPDECTFSPTPGGFVRLTLADGTVHPRVNVHRSFPLSGSDRFISIRDMEGDEIGIIKELKAFPPETVELLTAELNRRYFTPTITKIDGIKEEFGYAYWDVQTDAGPRRFTVRDMYSNVIPLSEDRVYIIDVDGNRYDIPHVGWLGPRSRKFIEDLR